MSNTQVNVEDVKATIKVDQAGAKLLVDALLRERASIIECDCESCMRKELRERAKDVKDIEYLIYPISKLTRHSTIQFTKLSDIKEKIADAHKEHYEFNEEDEHDS